MVMRSVRHDSLICRNLKRLFVKNCKILKNVHTKLVGNTYSQNQSLMQHNLVKYSLAHMLFTKKLQLFAKFQLPSRMPGCGTVLLPSGESKVLLRQKVIALYVSAHYSRAKSKSTTRVQWWINIPTLDLFVEQIVMRSSAAFVFEHFDCLVPESVRFLRTLNSIIYSLNIFLQLWNDQVHENNLFFFHLTRQKNYRSIALDEKSFHRLFFQKNETQCALYLLKVFPWALLNK